MRLSIFNFLLFTLCLENCVSAATVHFSIVLTWARRNVAGFTRDIVLMNNQYPGPPLILNQGDSVIFDVHNECPFNVTVHFHGKNLTALAQRPPP